MMPFARCFPRRALKDDDPVSQDIFLLFVIFYSAFKVSVYIIFPVLVYIFCVFFYFVHNFLFNGDIVSDPVTRFIAAKMKSNRTKNSLGYRCIKSRKKA